MFFNPLQISLLGKASLALSLKKGVFKNEIRVCLIRIEGRGREHADKVLRLVGDVTEDVAKPTACTLSS